MVNQPIRLKIKKQPPPSKRISFHAKKLKITDAKIEKLGKDAKEFTIARINHLPTMGQVRLHTKEMLFPGEYQITLTVKGDPAEDLKVLSQSQPS